MHSGLHSSQTGDTPHQTVVCYKWCWHVCLCLCVSACVHNHTRVCVTVCTAAACLHSMRRRWSGFRSEGCEVAWWKLAHGGGEKSPDLPSSPQSSKDWTSNPPGLSQMFNSDEKGKRTLVSCQENLLCFHPRCCHRKGSRFFSPQSSVSYYQLSCLTEDTYTFQVNQSGFAMPHTNRIVKSLLSGVISVHLHETFHWAHSGAVLRIPSAQISKTHCPLFHTSSRDYLNETVMSRWGITTTAFLHIFLTFPVVNTISYKWMRLCSKLLFH